MFRNAIRARVSLPPGRQPAALACRWNLFQLRKISGSKASVYGMNDIHFTPQYSAPPPRGVTRLCADENDKLARDWFRGHVLQLGAEYRVNARGSQYAVFSGEDYTVPPIAMGRAILTQTGIKTRGPLALLNWTNEEGARFFSPLGSSTVYTGQTGVEQAHASLSNDSSGITMGDELAKIGYVGDGPNTFEEFPISAHFEVHVEQATDLEKAGKPVGWVEGWHGITYYEVIFAGEDGHANTYPMYGRRNALTGAAKLMTQLETLAYTNNGYTTVTNIQSGPWGACNIQLKTKDMGADIVRSVKGTASLHGLEYKLSRPVHLLPGNFWPEAVDRVVELAVIGVLDHARGNDGISHCAKEWSDKEDCEEGALVLGKATHPIANPGAVVQGAQYRFTLLSERLIRFEWAEDGHFEDRASTFAINREFPVPRFRIVDDDELEIITEYFHVSYTKQKFSPESLIVHFSGKSVKYGTPWRFGTPTEFNLGGTARTLDGVDGRCDMGQGVLSKAGYAVIDDSESMLFDGKGFVASRQAGDRADCYLFCYGRDYKAAIKAFYAVSGKQPVVPRFVLGNWWSRYFAYHQDEYIALVDKFREHSIPLSVAVLDMDWHYVSDERVPHAGWTGYTWNEKLFPNPARFKRDIHKRQLRITLNDHPHGGIHAHEAAYEEMALFLGHDTRDRNPILFDPASPKFMEAYFGILHRRLEREVCDFWWIDWQQGPYSKIPGFDPLWLLNHFQYLDSKHTGSVPLIFSRYGGPGSHRYPIGFSGDTVNSHATASNIGFGWWSHDIGGHIRGIRDDELLIRWTQLGVFSPVMRLHSTSSRWNSKEPWLYGDECSRVMAEFLRFRHRLVPYLYTQNVTGSSNDEPLVQPMYWSWPNEPNAYKVPNQYFLGSELLVAPIVRPRDKQTNLASVKAWLPPGGRFVDIFCGTVYDGGRMVTFYRPIDKYPVLAPEGSIVTLTSEAYPGNGCLNPPGIEALVIVGKDGRASLIENVVDDDFSLFKEQVTHAPNLRVAWTIDFKQATGELTARIPAGKLNLNLRFLGMNLIPQGIRVLADGRDLTNDGIDVRLDRYSNKPCLSIFFSGFVSLRPTTITISLGPDPQLGVLDHTARLEELIRGYQAEVRMKDQLWNAIEEGKGRPLSIISSLLALGYDEAIVGPLVELIAADSRPCPG
ncbi:glycosyl hydrolases family 31-domain-containing protein [Aspergillus foveolatus]|uniref:glycosyl hydrolases family 31-domain-containing protein n=1 Tax=Aspergillus foveolatus TaxID=210207 RepID=UPI003CCD492F